MAEEKFQIEKYITKMLEQRNVGIRSKHNFFIEINKILTITEVTFLHPLFDWKIKIRYWLNSTLEMQNKIEKWQEVLSL
jgi:hypothetical protein